MERTLLEANGGNEPSPNDDGDRDNVDVGCPEVPWIEEQRRYELCQRVILLLDRGSGEDVVLVQSGWKGRQRR